MDIRTKNGTPSSLRRNCDVCVKKKVKCPGDQDGKGCRFCLKKGIRCHYSVKQKPGPKCRKRKVQDLGPAKEGAEASRDCSTSQRQTGVAGSVGSGGGDAGGEGESPLIHLRPPKKRKNVPAPGYGSLGGAGLDGGAGSSGAQHASTGGPQLSETAMQADGNLGGAGGESAGPVGTVDLSSNGESFVFGDRMKTGVEPGVGIHRSESLAGSAASGGGVADDGCGVGDDLSLDDSEIWLAFEDSISQEITDAGRCGSNLGVHSEQVLEPLPLMGTGSGVDCTSPSFPPVFEPDFGAGKGFRDASSGGTQLSETAMLAGGNLGGVGGGSAGPASTVDLSGNGGSFVFGDRTKTGAGPGVGIHQSKSLGGSTASGGGGVDGGCGVGDDLSLDDSEVCLALGGSIPRGDMDAGRCGSDLGVRREQVLRYFRQESQLQLQQLQQLQQLRQQRSLPLVGTGGGVNRVSHPSRPYSSRAPGPSKGSVAER